MLEILYSLVGSGMLLDKSSLMVFSKLLITTTRLMSIDMDNKHNNNSKTNNNLIKNRSVLIAKDHLDLQIPQEKNQYLQQNNNKVSKNARDHHAAHRKTIKFQALHLLQNKYRNYNVVYAWIAHQQVMTL